MDRVAEVRIPAACSESAGALEDPEADPVADPEADPLAVPVAARIPAAVEADRAGRACPFLAAAAVEEVRTRAVPAEAVPEVAAHIPAAVVFSVL